MLKRFVENKRFLILLDQAIFSGTSFLMTIFLARKLESHLFGIYSGLILGVFFVYKPIEFFGDTAVSGQLSQARK